MTSRINNSQTVDTKQVNEVNEYTQLVWGGGSPITPTHDNNGNLLSDGTKNFVYDEENRLTQVYEGATLKLQMAYDALSNRVVTNHGSEITLQVSVGGPGTLEERSADGALQREFVYGHDFLEPVVMVDHTSAGALPAGQSEPLYYLQDMMRSVVALTDSTGTVVEKYKYEAYGATYILSATGSPLPASGYGNPFLWTGQHYDAATNLYLYQYRAYSPTLGRFLQRDPIGYADGMNMYQYAGSNAIGAIDPLGLQKDPPGYHGPVVRQPRKQSGNPSSGAPPKRGPRKNPEKNKYNTDRTNCEPADAMRREIEDLADEIDDLNNTIDQLNNDIGKLDGSIRQLLTQEGVLCKLLIEAEIGKIYFEEASNKAAIGSMTVAVVGIFVPGPGWVIAGVAIGGVLIDGGGLYFALKSGDRAAVVQAIKDDINQIDLQKAYARGQMAAKSAEIARRQNEIKNRRNRIQELLNAAANAQARCDEEKKSNQPNGGETGGHGGGGGGRKGGIICGPQGCTTG